MYWLTLLQTVWVQEHSHMEKIAELKPNMAWQNTEESQHSGIRTVVLHVYGLGFSYTYCWIDFFPSIFALPNLTELGFWGYCTCLISLAEYAEHNELLSLKYRLHLQTIHIAITNSFCFSPFLLENCMNLCSVEDFTEISVSFDAYICKCPKIPLCFYLCLYLFQKTNKFRQANKQICLPVCS